MFHPHTRGRAGCAQLHQARKTTQRRWDGAGKQVIGERPALVAGMIGECNTSDGRTTCRLGNKRRKDSTQEAAPQRSKQHRCVTGVAHIDCKPVRLPSIAGMVPVSEML